MVRILLTKISIHFQVAKSSRPSSVSPWVALLMTVLPSLLPAMGAASVFTLYSPAILKPLQLIILCARGPLGLKNPSLFSSSILLEITAQEDALCTGHVLHVRRCYSAHGVCELAFLFAWTESPWEQELSFNPACLSRI